MKKEPTCCVSTSENKERDHDHHQSQHWLPPPRINMGLSSGLLDALNCLPLLGVDLFVSVIPRSLLRNLAAVLANLANIIGASQCPKLTQLHTLVTAGSIAGLDSHLGWMACRSPSLKNWLFGGSNILTTMVSDLPPRIDRNHTLVETAICMESQSSFTYRE